MIELPPAQLADVRRNIQDRVLWLSTAMVHWANRVRPNPDGAKVGGHQASSASAVGILSTLFFETLRGVDRVAVKPHAAPVFHAIQFLLGKLETSDLASLRDLGGLQAYPSRTKDPDAVDFSTGSMGLGVAATAYAALVRDYLRTHDMPPTSGRIWAHVGDAELEEGSVFETLTEAAHIGASDLIWVVDVNRQSLDRVAPGIRVDRFRDMFRVNGWAVFEAKYGRPLEEVFARPGGHALRQRIDAMSNEEYQALITTPADLLRERLQADVGRLGTEIARATADVSDCELVGLLQSLGGHDMSILSSAYQEASKSDGPAVVFAYTVKGWGLPIAGYPLNHSAMLTDEQFARLAERLGEDPDDPWRTFPDGSAEAAYIEAACQRLQRASLQPAPSFDIDWPHPRVPARTSTQEMFGRFLVEIDRTSPVAAARVVTMSPDVATSTNLGSWINRVGVWARGDVTDGLDFARRPLKWQQSASGRHIELGLSEMNLFLALGQFGLSQPMSGQRLIPIGTVYDCFIPRGLDALLYGTYQQTSMILVATPSGITLSSEGGAHQSIITPSLGIEIPGLSYYEPCFARDLFWILSEAMRSVGSGEATSFYIRLSTKVVDQALFPAPSVARTEEALRRQALRGCYRLRSADAASRDVVNIFAVGAMVPEALAAVGPLADEGLDTSVFAVTSPDLVYRSCRLSTEAEATHGVHVADPIGILFDHEERRPLVTVIDGHPHSLSFLGSALDCPSTNLGVHQFGESGDRKDLYKKHQIDVDAIVTAAIGVSDRPPRARERSRGSRHPEPTRQGAVTYRVTTGP